MRCLQGLDDSITPRCSFFALLGSRLEFGTGTGTGGLAWRSGVGENVLCGDSVCGDSHFHGASVDDTGKYDISTSYKMRPYNIYGMIVHGYLP